MTLLNIGLAAKGRPNHTPEEALAALRIIGGGRAIRAEVHPSDTEPTLVVEVRSPLYAAALFAVAASLNQDAIAQFDPHSGGQLVGPNASAWGEFDPDQFLTLRGQRLSETVATPAHAWRDLGGLPSGGPHSRLSGPSTQPQGA